MTRLFFLAFLPLVFSNRLYFPTFLPLCKSYVHSAATNSDAFFLSETRAYQVQTLNFKEHILCWKINKTVLLEVVAHLMKHGNTKYYNMRCRFFLNLSLAKAGGLTIEYTCFVRKSVQIIRMDELCPNRCVFCLFVSNQQVCCCKIRGSIMIWRWTSHSSFFDLFESIVPHVFLP